MHSLGIYLPSVFGSLKQLTGMIQHHRKILRNQRCHMQWRGWCFEAFPCDKRCHSQTCSSGFRHRDVCGMRVDLGRKSGWVCEYLKIPHHDFWIFYTRLLVIVEFTSWRERWNFLSENKIDIFSRTLPIPMHNLTKGCVSHLNWRVKHGSKLIKAWVKSYF